MSLDFGRKPDHLEETQGERANTERTLGTPVRNLTQDLPTVRRQSYTLPHHLQEVLQLPHCAVHLSPKLSVVTRVRSCVVGRVTLEGGLRSMDWDFHSWISFRRLAHASWFLHNQLLQLGLF